MECITEKLEIGEYLKYNAITPVRSAKFTIDGENWEQGYYLGEDLNGERALIARVVTDEGEYQDRYWVCRNDFSFLD